MALHVRITWRDENYGPIHRAAACRTMLEKRTERGETALRKILQEAGFVYHARRASWIAEGLQDSAPADLVTRLTAEGIAVEHAGAIPASLKAAMDPLAAWDRVDDQTWWQPVDAAEDGEAAEVAVFIVRDDCPDRSVYWVDVKRGGDSQSLPTQVGTAAEAAALGRELVKEWQEKLSDLVAPRP